MPFQEMFPGKVAIDKNNQKILDNFIKEQMELRGL